MCGVISNFFTWEMWRFLRFIHMWRNFRFLHTADVEKYEISPHVACVWCKNVNTYAKFMLFCYKISFFCNLRNFVAKSVVLWFSHFCVEKNLSKNCISGEKMTNMRSGYFGIVTNDQTNKQPGEPWASVLVEQKEKQTFTILRWRRYLYSQQLKSSGKVVQWD